MLQIDFFRYRPLAAKHLFHEGTLSSYENFIDLRQK